MGTNVDSSYLHLHLHHQIPRQSQRQHQHHLQTDQYQCVFLVENGFSIFIIFITYHLVILVHLSVSFAAVESASTFVNSISIGISININISRICTMFVENRFTIFIIIIIGYVITIVL